MPTLAQKIVARRALAAAVGRRARRSRKLYRPKQPRGAQLAYYRRVRTLIEQIQEQIDSVVLPQLPEILREAELERAGLRLDSSVELVDRIFRSLRVYREGQAEEIVIASGDEFDRHNRREVQRQFRSVLGLELIEAEQGLGPTVEAFVHENTLLVKSVPEDLLRDLERNLLQDIRLGKSEADLKFTIRERFRISKRRAAFLVRDQALKLNAQLTRRRHENVGIVEYIWDTSGDEKVRAAHRPLNGRKFRYNKPPIVSYSKSGRPRRENPGGDYGCRCNALPVMPQALLAAAGSLAQ